MNTYKFYTTRRKNLVGLDIDSIELKVRTIEAETFAFAYDRLPKNERPVYAEINSDGEVRFCIGCCYSTVHPKVSDLCYICEENYYNNQINSHD